MNEKKFKERYIAAFLGAWAAQGYQMACASGNHEVFGYHPVEDAEGLADKAWKSLVDAGIVPIL